MELEENQHDCQERTDRQRHSELLLGREGHVHPTLGSRGDEPSLRPAIDGQRRQLRTVQLSDPAVVLILPDGQDRVRADRSGQREGPIGASPAQHLHARPGGRGFGSLRRADLGVEGARLELAGRQDPDGVLSPHERDRATRTPREPTPADEVSSAPGHFGGDRLTVDLQVGTKTTGHPDEARSVERRRSPPRTVDHDVTDGQGQRAHPGSGQRALTVGLDKAQHERSAGRARQSDHSVVRDGAGDGPSPVQDDLNPGRALTGNALVGLKTETVNDARIWPRQTQRRFFVGRIGSPVRQGIAVGSQWCGDRRPVDPG